MSFMCTVVTIIIIIFLVVNSTFLIRLCLPLEPPEGHFLETWCACRGVVAIERVSRISISSEQENTVILKALHHHVDR